MAVGKFRNKDSKRIDMINIMAYIHIVSLHRIINKEYFKLTFEIVCV